MNSTSIDENQRPEIHLAAPLDQTYLLGAEMQPAWHGAAFTEQMAMEEVARH